MNKSKTIHSRSIIMKKPFLFFSITIVTLLLFHFFTSFTFKEDETRSLSFSKKQAIQFMLSLRQQSLESEKFDINWFLEDEEFPFATDWLYQDLKEDLPEWFINKNNSELKDRIIEKFIPELGDEVNADYLSLKEEGEISDNDWLSFYFDLCEKRRAKRLSTIPPHYRKLVFTKHFDMGGSHYAYTENPTDATGSEKKCDHPDYEKGSALCIYTLEGNYGRVEVLESTPKGVIRDPDVSYDGKRILYSKRNSRDQDDYHIYEYDLTTKTIRQITFGLGFADVEPAYLPDGNIIFNSTRCMQTVDCFYPDVTNLYISDNNGKYIRRIGYDQVHTNYPKVMDNGKVIYTRWDYNDRCQIYPQPLFEMNIDGTRQTEYYGNNSWWPTTVGHARGIEDSDKVIAIATGHHCRQVGALILLDVKQGRQEAEGATLVAPVVADKRDRRYRKVDAYVGFDGHYQYPYAINEREYVVSYGTRPPRAGSMNGYGLYYVRDDGARELLVTDREISCNQPVFVRPRPRPALPPTPVDYRKTTGTYYVQDVYFGPGLEGVPRGTVKKLRVVALDYRPAAVQRNGNRGPAGGALVSTPVACNNGTWDVKRVLGDATVHEDGSAFFNVPARTPVYFQCIDGEGQAVQTMRTWSTLQPGENFSCIGCHESKDTVPPAPAGGVTLAMKAGVQKLAPFYGPPRGFSFLKEIQPILNRHCVECHDGDVYKIGRASCRERV